MRTILQYITYFMVFLFITACDKVDDNSFNKDLKAQADVAPSLFILQNDKVLLEQNQLTYISFLQNDDVPPNIDFTFSKPKNGELILASANVWTSPDGIAIPSINNYSISYQPNPDFYGKDSIVYTVCEQNGICKNATIYIQVVSTKVCQWKEMPFILQDKKLQNLEVDTIFLDFSDVQCSLNLSIQEGYLGWVNIKEIQKNQFMIFYQAPTQENFEDKIQLTICEKQGQLCKSYVLLYQQNALCNTWLARDDTFVIKSSTNDTDAITFSKEKLFANDEYCFNIQQKIRIKTFPSHGKMFMQDNEFIYYPDMGGIKEDYFIYEVCNSQGQCTEALVKILIN